MQPWGVGACVRPCIRACVWVQLFFCRSWKWAFYPSRTKTAAGHEERCASNCTWRRAASSAQCGDSSGNKKSLFCALKSRFFSFKVKLFELSRVRAGCSPDKQAPLFSADIVRPLNSWPFLSTCYSNFGSRSWVLSCAGMLTNVQLVDPQ